ncbi:hypothetical protein ABZ079_16645 [Streptomyces sp. NPDC006314]
MVEDERRLRAALAPSRIDSSTGQQRLGQTERGLPRRPDVSRQRR